MRTRFRPIRPIRPRFQPPVEDLGSCCRLIGLFIYHCFAAWWMPWHCIRAGGRAASVFRRRRFNGRFEGVDLKRKEIAELFNRSPSQRTAAKSPSSSIRWFWCAILQDFFFEFRIVSGHLVIGSFISCCWFWPSPLPPPIFCLGGGRGRVTILRCRLSGSFRVLWHITFGGFSLRFKRSI